MTNWTPPAPVNAASSVAWRFLVIVAAVALFVTGLVALGVIVMPLIFGLLFAMVLWPLSTKLRERGWRPGLAAFAGWVIVGLALSLLVVLSVKALIGPWPTFADGISAGLDELEKRLNDAFDGDLTTSNMATVRQGAGEAIGLLMRGAFVVVSVAFSAVSTLLLSMLVLFFYLKDGNEMWQSVTSMVGGRESLIDRAGRKMWHAVRAFLIGTATVAVVDAVGIGLGAWIIGVPSVLSIAVITFFLAFVPYFGAIVGGAIACLVALGDGGVGPAIAMLVVVLFVQQLESNLLQPVLVGRSTRLHPLVVALGVIAGGSIAGVLGMFLAVPVIAAAVAAITELRRTADEEVAVSAG
jgi:predicted PurR-regulated permease PerM